MDLAAFEDLLHYIERDISKNRTRLWQPISGREPLCCMTYRKICRLKNTPRMNTFVHKEFYECNAGCMQGVNARMHVVCRLHASCIRSYAGCIRSYAGCTLHASVMWTRLNRTQTTSLRGSALYKYINWNLTERFVCCALFTGHQCADAIGWSPGWISRRAVQLGRGQHRHHAGQRARHSPSRFPDSSVLQCLFLLDVWRRFFEAPQQNSVISCWPHMCRLMPFKAVAAWTIFTVNSVI